MNTYFKKIIIFLCFQNQEHVDSQPKKKKESRACLVFLCSILTPQICQEK